MICIQGVEIPYAKLKQQYTIYNKTMNIVYNTVDQ